MILRVVEEVLLTLLVVAGVCGGIWTHRDARRRIEDPFFLWTATLLGVVPVLGPLLYALLRPPETLHEVQIRRLELRELEVGLTERGPFCHACGSAVKDDFRLCPVCTTRLKKACVACGGLLQTNWLSCPWCAEPALEIPPFQADLDAALTAETAAAAAAP